MVAFYADLPLKTSRTSQRATQPWRKRRGDGLPRRSLPVGRREAATAEWILIERKLC
jgi:hypothetical protein